VHDARSAIARGISELAAVGPTGQGEDIHFFLAKLDASGSPLWSKSFGDMENQQGAGMTVDSAGNVLIAGTFASTVNFGGSTLVASGNDNDIFVAKLDANGEHLWSNRFGDSSDQFGASIAVDSAGNVLLTGSFTGSVSFGGK
jgi:outer membrane protein assembly factor BamB